MADSATIAITGGAGFLGRAVCRALRAEGAQLRLWAGPLDPAGSDVVGRGDLAGAAPLGDWLRGCAAVVHLAGDPLVGRSFHAPLPGLAVSVLGTTRLLQACAEAGVRRLVFASSAEVYAESDGPTAEAAPLAPASPYAIGKRAAEELLTLLGPRLGVEVVVLRFFLVYGRRSDGQGLLAHVAACRDEALCPLERPELRRDLVYVDDAAQAVCKALTVPVTGLATFNVGSGEAHELGALAARLLAQLGSSARVQAVPPTRGREPALRCADCTLAETVLGWHATTPLTAGLRASFEAE